MYMNAVPLAAHLPLARMAGGPRSNVCCLCMQGPATLVAAVEALDTAAVERLLTTAQLSHLVRPVVGVG